jgi:thiol-disulfide isomerase/thioredoxin
MVRPTRALSASTLMILVSGIVASQTTATAADPPDAVPRYQLKVGQELVFKEESNFKYGKAPHQGSIGSRSDWTVWTVRKNDDGSYRLVLRSVERSKFDGKESGEPRSSLAYFDLTTDGRLLPNSTIGFQVDPASIFPRLAADERELRNGWTEFNRQTEAASTFQVQSRPKSAGQVWTIRELRKTPMDEIYLSTYKATITFDPARGLADKFESESTQGYGFDGKGTGTTEFVSTATHDAAWSNQLWEQADRFFTASKAYHEKMKLASRDADAAKKLADEAKALLVAAQKIVTLPVVKDQLAQELKQHDQMVTYCTEQAHRRAEIVGRPAADFTADDLKGKPHALKDFKGKVVIMDFWYRGCGWCMRAMPQVKELEEEFRDQPVAVLGMNTDRNEADAKFVIDKMGLTYLTLKAEGLPEKYGVRGFPTLVIIDKQGKVQDLYVGYSPDLHKEVGEIVRNLLAKK